MSSSAGSMALYEEIRIREEARQAGMTIEQYMEWLGEGTKQLLEDTAAFADLVEAQLPKDEDVN